MTVSIEKTEPIDREAIKTVNALTQRVQKRKRAWVEASRVVCAQTSHSFKKSWEETEGLHPDLRHAKAFVRIMKESPVVIREGELIVGSITKYVGGVNVNASGMPYVILKELKEKTLHREGSETKWAKRCF